MLVGVGLGVGTLSSSSPSLSPLPWSPATVCSSFLVSLRQFVDSTRTIPRTMRVCGPSNDRCRRHRSDHGLDSEISNELLFPKMARYFMVGLRRRIDQGDRYSQNSGQARFFGVSGSGSSKNEKPLHGSSCHHIIITHHSANFLNPPLQQREAPLFICKRSAQYCTL